LVGRLVELSSARASAALSLAFELVLEAQRRGENVVWLTGPADSFWPPDVAELGVDLDALVVVRAPRAADVATAADWIARSGAFGLVVLDLTTLASANVPIAAQSRLLSLAQKHSAALVCLTRKSSDRPSLSSLVSLRAEASLRRRGRDAFECELAILKDKQRPATWKHVAARRATPGLH
jgi:recombination protein RecA